MPRPRAVRRPAGHHPAAPGGWALWRDEDTAHATSTYAAGTTDDRDDRTAHDRDFALQEELASMNVPGPVSASSSPLGAGSASGRQTPAPRSSAGGKAAQKGAGKSRRSSADGAAGAPPAALPPLAVPGATAQAGPAAADTVAAATGTQLPSVISNALGLPLNDEPVIGAARGKGAGAAGRLLSVLADVESEFGDLPEGRFLDRERSWLAFNERVLELAEEPDVPLLERAKFLAIFASNLDEFFMVRVAGLKRRIATGVATRSAAGLQPREVLDQIWRRSRELMARHAAAFQHEVLPDLAAEGIEVVRWPDLADKEQARLHTLFRQQIFPVLTPLAVDPAHPFPYISGLSLNLAVVVRNPVSGHKHFARVKVPQSLSRFLEASPQRYVPLEDVMGAHLEELFPGMEVLAHHTFRVTRNEDLEVEEDDAENILKALEKELMRRRFGPPVRLEVEESIDPYILDLLVRELNITEAEVFPLPGPLDLTGLFGIAGLDRPELKYPKFVAGTARGLTDVESASQPDIFAAMRERDVLLHHPYDSFSTSVQAFLEQAAADPHVLAIKQTLYRTSGDSPIVDALIDAAESGKQVLVLVEIKARFDEQANIKWARKLEESGCHVVYGLVGLKTHCKLSLVVRQEGDTLRRYAHVGTGNYHPKTARLYEDLGLLTADPQVGADLSDLFNRLSGYSRRESYRRLLTAPRGLRDGLVSRIHGEIAHHRAGRPAYVKIKVNSIVDEALIDALYRASQAGVPVDVWVRGICAIRPGVPGLSENVRVRSILGRFLEHSRIFVFGNGGEPEVWFGSADMMHRNLDRRIEALVRVTDPAHRTELSGLLDLGVSDGTESWHLGPDGAWTRHATDSEGHPLLHVQDLLIASRQRRRSPAVGR
ncbi:RNA degradosome polyphosphate kinase [Kitasatospora paranensis]|uniref:Polyphosphate kinase n=1 Tax=Kitasatospora paranensis TaxID=258053 RepID=A0ABW2FPY7_9ACTN